MKLNVTVIGLAASFLLMGQTAFANDASSQQSVKASTHVTYATKSETTKRSVKVVKLPVTHQKNATQSVSKGRVIHNVKLGQAEKNLFRPMTKKTPTPNLYRD